MPDAPRRLLRIHGQLLAHSDRLLALCDDPATLDLNAPRVSAWSVRLQVEHIAAVGLAGTKLMRRLLAEGRGSQTGSPSPAGWLVLVTNRIPRGRAKAPKYVLPAGAPIEQVRERLLEIRAAYDELEPRLGELPGLPGTEPHPVLGQLNAARWLRFALVHETHHLAIIDEIRRAAPRT